MSRKNKSTKNGLPKQHEKGCQQEYRQSGFGSCALFSDIHQDIKHYSYRGQAARTEVESGTNIRRDMEHHLNESAPNSWRKEGEEHHLEESKEEEEHQRVIVVF